jgi:hypothetical protein
MEQDKLEWRLREQTGLKEAEQERQIKEFMNYQQSNDFTFKF